MPDILTARTCGVNTPYVGLAHLLMSSYELSLMTVSCSVCVMHDGRYGSAG